MFRSACFGRLHAHHQEPTAALTPSGFILEHGGSSIVGRGLVGWLIYLHYMMMRGPANVKTAQHAAVNLQGCHRLI
jgi:hypothetical protein